MRTLMPVLVVLGALACDAPVGPSDGAAPTPPGGLHAAVTEYVAGPVVPAATGAGHTLVAGALRTFSFLAWRDADGTAHGTAEIYNRLVNEKFAVSVDCLKLIGNVAIMSGTISRHDDPQAVGLTGVFAVIDAGEGGGATDSVTQVHFFLPGTLTCLVPDETDARALAAPVLSGGVQVH